MEVLITKLENLSCLYKWLLEMWSGHQTNWYLGMREIIDPLFELVIKIHGKSSGSQVEQS